MEGFWHSFFTFGLIYSTFFSLFGTVTGVARWLHDRPGAPRETPSALRSAAAHGEQGERAVEDALRAVGIPTLRNVFLHGPGGRLTEIDIVALVGPTILVLEVKAWVGRVTGSAADGDWVQDKGRGVEKPMKNPLRQNEHHLRVLRRALPETRTEGVVVFTEATFPEAPPPGVLDIPALLRMVQELRTTAPHQATMLAWARLSTWSMQQDKNQLHDRLVAQVNGMPITVAEPSASGATA